MKNNALGIYIHIPFCISKCVYCDFLSAPADEQTHTDYVNALIKEIEYKSQLYREELKSFTVKTIFFGGGTPSAVNEKHIVNIMEAIRRNFSVCDNAEVTIECNPGTLTEIKAVAYKGCGINRISFGVQAADEKVLKMLGRIHTFEDFKDSMRIARAAGFNNINADIMSALPGQTYEEYIDGLKRILALEPEHISAYSLIVEDNTPLCDRLGEYPPLPDEDTERRMYYATKEILQQKGYVQYEISNYAKKGFECSHNKTYWDRICYIGFGLGAASLFNSIRTTNISDLQNYIKLAGETDVYDERTQLTQSDCMEEFLFLGLRKTKGISFDEFKKCFNTDIMEVYGDTIRKNIEKGLLKFTYKDSGLKSSEDYLTENVYGCALTDRGIDISNVVLAEFLF